MVPFPLIRGNFGRAAAGSGRDLLPIANRTANNQGESADGAKICALILFFLVRRRFNLRNEDVAVKLPSLHSGNVELVF